MKSFSSFTTFFFIALLCVLFETQQGTAPLLAITDTPSTKPTSMELFDQAKSLENAGRYREANQVYRSLSHSEPAYALFCVYGMARNYERMGESARAIRVYAKLLSASGRVESPDFDTKTLILASLERVYKLGATQDSVERQLDRFSRYFPGSLYYSTLLAIDRGDARKAAQVALKLFEIDEEHYTALLLQRLAGERTVIAFLSRKGFTSESLLDIAMEKGLYENALSFSYLLPDSGDLFAKRAFCFYRMRDFEAAAPLYLEYFRETGDPDALIKLSYISFHQQRFEQARKYLNQYISHPRMAVYEESLNREAAYMKMQLGVRSRNVEASLNAVRNFLYSNEGNRYSDIAATVAFYNALQKGSLSRALAYLHDIRSYLHTDYYKAWAAYILGIYVDNSMFSAAMHLRPGSYYSFRSALRLEEDTENVLKKPLSSIESLAPVADSVLYELCSLGYTAELEYLCQSALRLSAEDGSAGYLFLLSKLAYASGDPYRGIIFAEKLLSTLDSPALLSLPREILELLYPKVFVDLITDSLKDRETEMELFLVLSIVREESRYNSTARSSKGALGLMQLMPNTASWILQDEISAVQLLQPSINISAGTTYLDYLYRRFDITEYVVASYNGGPNNVGKWISVRKGRSLEEFIEEIPYRETRNFVKKVYTSYQMYRFLYSDEPFLVD